MGAQIIQEASGDIHKRHGDSLSYNNSVYFPNQKVGIL